MALSRGLIAWYDMFFFSALAKMWKEERDDVVVPKGAIQELKELSDGSPGRQMEDDKTDRAGCESVDRAIKPMVRIDAHPICESRGC